MHLAIDANACPAFIGLVDRFSQYPTRIFRFTFFMLPLDLAPLAQLLLRCHLARDIHIGRKRSWWQNLLRGDCLVGPRQPLLDGLLAGDQGATLTYLFG